MALGVDDATYILVSAYSTVMSAIYLFLVIIVGKKALLHFMPDFKEDKNMEKTPLQIENHEHELFLGLFRKDNLKHLGIGLLLTIAIIFI
jgi:hypothetical protein